MLSYSLLSLLIKHAMILNILRRYQLSPPPGRVKSRANFSLLQTPADGASPVLELREVEAFCGTLGRRKEGEGTQSRDTIRLLRGNTTNSSDGTFRVNNDKYPPKMNVKTYVSSFPSHHNGTTGSRLPASFNRSNRKQKQT